MGLRRIGKREKESKKKRMEKGECKKMNERKDERRKVESSMRKESLGNQLLMHCINR